MSETIDLKDLKELAEAATPGPWRHHKEVGPYTSRDEVWCDSPCKDEPDWSCPVVDDIIEQDAKFIAAANPKTVLELIARVEAAEGTVEAKDAAIVAGANTIHDLSTALEQAKAREAELRSALEPFANQSQHYDGIKGDSVRTAIQVQLGWLRNAVTAMGGDDA